MFDAGFTVTQDTAANFDSQPATLNKAVQKLEEAGFDILQISRTTINIAGSAATYKRAFQCEINLEPREVIKNSTTTEFAEFIDCPDSDLSGLIPTRGTAFANLLEGVAIEEPRYFMAPAASPLVPSPYPPLVDYWHLSVPAGVSLGCNADRAHRAGLTGKGVTIAMVDSGWYKHPYFVARGYRADSVVLAPGASEPLRDESGHGTGESANIFAVAPDVLLKPVKMSFTNSLAAFNAAVNLNPDVITCSWGSDIHTGPLSAVNIALATAIANAVKAGITVIFSAGNGHFGFPGQHPDVISAGGVYRAETGRLRASDYASGFMSAIYNDRPVPDLCGLVGMRPGAKYIMLPVEPGDDIDEGGAGGAHPAGDETTKKDGWASFSGTSAAAPQLAGAAALVKQAYPGAKPDTIRDILKQTATDITSGHCYDRPGQNHPAQEGPDLATGYGLLDAHRATMLARIRRRILLPALIPQPAIPDVPIQPRYQQYLETSPPSVQYDAPVKQPAFATARQPGQLGDRASLVTEEELDVLEEMVVAGEVDPAEV